MDCNLYEAQLIQEGNKIIAYDFDSPIYAAASVLQTNEILVTHKPTGREKIFKNVTAFYGRGKKRDGGWLGDINKGRKVPFLLEEFEIEKVSRVTEPDIAGKKFVIKMVNLLKDKPWSGDLKIIIDGPGNFRKDVAFSEEYKGTRSEKPLRWKAIREWFEEEYKGQYIIEEGQEADDAAAILGHWGWQQYLKTGINPVVMAHIDKDINSCPGWHYNFHTDEIEWIDEEQAHRNLWEQVLVGDGIDDIPGLPGISTEMRERWKIRKNIISVGKKTATNIVADSKTEQDMVAVVSWCFKSWFDEFPYEGKAWKEMMNEQFMLIKLLEYRMKIEDLDTYLERKGLTYGEKP